MPTHTGPASLDADIVAAGAVVTRPGREVLLVHRPRYDDWSFPKGKVDPGELLPACAVREVEEETGLRIDLGQALQVQHYRVGGRLKAVHYWLGRVDGDDEVAGYSRGDEIDEVAWVPWEDAERLLSYDHDRVTLSEALPLRRRTRAVLVLRHAQALARKAWDADDRERPLTDEGDEEAERLAPLLDAYGVTRVVSSSSTRCVDTVAPYAGSATLAIEVTDALSEEDATESAVRASVGDLLDSGETGLLCSHGPVLPWVFAALGLPVVALPKAGLVVAHVRRGVIVALEQYPAP